MTAGAPACFAALLAPLNAYLLGLLGAAAWRRRRPAPIHDAADRLRFAVVIPAHNEEASVGEALASLDGVDYPRSRIEPIVIADGCSDRTAQVAARAGATVWARQGGGGKGAALAWAFARGWPGSRGGCCSPRSRPGPRPRVPTRAGAGGTPTARRCSTRA